jgi:hypothetical protein
MARSPAVKNSANSPDRSTSNRIQRHVVLAGISRKLIANESVAVACTPETYGASRKFWRSRRQWSQRPQLPPSDGTPMR